MSGADVVWAARGRVYGRHGVDSTGSGAVVLGVSCWLLLCRGIVAGAMVSGDSVLLAIGARLTCRGAVVLEAAVRSDGKI